MCCCLGKQASNHSAKPGISAALGFNENAKSSSSGDTNFLAMSFSRDILNQESKHYGLFQNPSYPLISRTFEHVPKI